MVIAHLENQRTLRHFPKENFPHILAAVVQDKNPQAEAPLNEDFFSKAVIDFYLGQFVRSYKGYAPLDEEGKKSQRSKLQRGFLGTVKDGKFQQGLKKASSTADQATLAEVVFKVFKDHCNIGSLTAKNFEIDGGKEGIFFSEYSKRLFEKFPHLQKALEAPAIAGQG